MFKMPMIIVYAIIAFNITAFTAIVQIDFFSVKPWWMKAILWAFTIGAWWLTYKNRDTFKQIG